MRESIRQKIEKSCGFNSHPYVRWGFILLFLCMAIGSTYLAFDGYKLPYSAILAIITSGLLILYLCVDSILFVRYLHLTSPREVLPLVRWIDPKISKVIIHTEEYVRSLEGEKLVTEIESYAREISSDFETKPPYPRIEGAIFWRSISNFLVTIFCFAILALALAQKDKYCEGLNTYGHDCSQVKDFKSAVLHSVYYHSVIFQSLGDGEHGPKTIYAQAIATIETYIAFLYLIIIIGGIYSTAAIVRDNMTPRLFRESLAEYLTVLCAKEKPIRKEDLSDLRR